MMNYHRLIYEEDNKRTYWSLGYLLDFPEMNVSQGPLRTWSAP